MSTAAGKEHIVDVASTRARAVPLLAGASVRYWTALGILLVAAVAVLVLPRVLGAHLRKEAIPLTKPLAHFDPSRLAPRYIRHAATDRIGQMSEDTVESLGTHEFLQLYLADTTKSVDDPTRVAFVFVTYYTGKPDLVPHVPDECFMAAGYDALSKRTAKLRVAGIGAPGDEVHVRALQFRTPPKFQHGSTGSTDLTVMYLFSANDQWGTTRNDVRLILSNPWQRYAYYAKIEVMFSDDRLQHMATETQSLAALPDLLQTLVPVLFTDHIDIARFRGATNATQSGGV